MTKDVLAMRSQLLPRVDLDNGYLLEYREQQTRT